MSSFYFWLFMLSVCSVFVASLQPNFVFILTDDQDVVLDGMRPMSKTIQLVASQGKTFINAYANTPICCPSRSTILTGKYAHNTGVSNNSLSGNCSSLNWQKNHEPFSIAAILKKRGYINFYAGKYLNQYGIKNVGGTKHVPKGYDWWLGLKGNSKYYNYTLSINGTKHYFSNQYLTDVIANYSLDFLNQNIILNKPFFMMLATPASHEPFTPADRHKKYFPNVRAVRTPSFNYTPIHKHWLLHMFPKHLPNNVEMLDDIQKHRLQSLLSVDEMVESVINKLKYLGIYNRTYIIYMSDNGFHIGQFTLPWDKRQPYETDVKIPFIISGPNIPKDIVESFPVSTVDVAPTILDLSGIKVDKFNFDGKSFKNVLFEKNNDNVNLGNVSNYIFIEYFGESNSPSSVDEKCNLGYDLNVSHCSIDQWCKCQDSRNNTYTCVIEFSNANKFKFCQFYDEKNFVEAYDCMVDKYELNNIKSNLSKITKRKYKTIIRRFKKCSGKKCRRLNLTSKLNNY